MNFFAPESLSQAINPWSWWAQAEDNVAGFINIVNYKTGDSVLEKAIVQDVAGYGMQLNAIGRALEAVISALPQDGLTPERQAAVRAFLEMTREIADKKEKLSEGDLSAAKVDKLIRNMRELKRKNPARYRQIAQTLRDELAE